MILDEKVEVKLGGHNIKYYEELGYEIPRNNKGSVPRGTAIIVDVADVFPHSHDNVNVQCDYCGKTIQMEYRYYRQKFEKYGSIACKECGSSHYKQTMQKKYNVDNYFQTDECKEKSKKTNLEKYGTEYASQSDEVKNKVKATNIERYGTESVFQSKDIYQKAKDTLYERYGVYYPCQNEEIHNKVYQTCIEKYGTPFPTQTDEVQKKIISTNLDKYGVPYVLQNDEIKDKIKQTCVEKYGVDNPLKSEEIREKIQKTNDMKYGGAPTATEEVQEKTKQTNLNRYGVEYGLQSKEIREKGIQTSLEKYGTKHPFQNPQVREKARKTMFKNSSIRASKQQIYINQLYNGILNKPVQHIAVDIMLDNFCVEYDGGGHDIQVRLNEITEEQYLIRERERENFLLSNGIKIMRIISSNDKLPLDDVLIHMKEIANDILLHHKKICFDVNSNGYLIDDVDFVSFNYGKLRRVKNTDINEEVNNE